MPRGLSVEQGIYLILILVAFFLRFWDLGMRPLSHDEASLAHRAWLFYQGQDLEVAPGPSPVLFQTSLLAYFIFGASDTAVRLAPALLGTAMVAIPFFLRGQLGQYGALAAALMLAISPTIVFYSRYLGSPILGGFGSLLLITAIFRYWEERRPLDFYLISLGLGFTLLAGRAGVSILLAFTTFSLGYSLVYLRTTRRPLGELLASRVRPLLPSRQVLSTSGLLLSFLLLILPTGGFLLPQGVGELAQDFFLGDSSSSSALPVFLFLAYELLLVLLGLLAIVNFSGKEPKVWLFLLWLGGALVLGNRADPVQITLPFIFLGATFTQEVWARDHGGKILVEVGRFLIFSLPLFLYLVVQWAGYAQSGEEQYLILMSVALLSSVLLFALFASWQGWSAAVKGGILSLLIAAGGFTLHSTARLAYLDPTASPEFMLAEFTSPDVRNLVSDLEAYSNQITDEKHALEIVTRFSDPVLYWYLRDFRKLHLVEESESQSGEAIITRGDEILEQQGYFGQRYALQVRFLLPESDFRSLSRWYLLRDVGAAGMSSDIILWVSEQSLD